MRRAGHGKRLLAALLVAAILPATSGRAEPEESFIWGQVATGGGGYVTGMVTQPITGDIYVRTDVGGIYKFDRVARRYRQLFYGPMSEYENAVGIHAIAVDPQQPGVLYAAAGAISNRQDVSWGGSGNQLCDIFKSTDDGESWIRLNFNKDFAANGNNRGNGEALMVDPANSDIVYCATPFDGVWRSENGGTDWSLVADIPQNLDGMPGDPRGARSVLFDPKSVRDGKCQVIYVGVLDSGVWRSVDGGESFSLLPNSPKNPARMDLALNNALYIAAGSQLVKYQDGRMTDISPRRDGYYGAVSADPKKPDALVAVYQRNGTVYLNNLFYSDDGGRTWTDKTAVHKMQDCVPWWYLERFAACVAHVAFDWFDQNRLWVCDWSGVYVTADITAAEPVFTSYMDGLAETCHTDLICPPTGAPLISLAADIDGFRHERIDAFPTTNFKMAYDGVGIDYCREDPNLVVRVTTQDHGNRGGWGATSTDNGVTWTPFDTYPDNTLGKPQEDWDPYDDGMTNGKVAVGAQKLFANGRWPAIVAYPLSEVPQYSHDFGKTWSASTGAPKHHCNEMFRLTKSIVSDSVNGNRFYIAHFNGNNQLEIYESTDGGASFHNTSTQNVGQLGWEAQSEIKAVPGKEGAFYAGVKGGTLFYFENGGTTVRRLSNVTGFHNIAFGKEKEPGGPKAIYLYATVNGVEGIHQSLDNGITWRKIIEGFALPNLELCMEGDNQTYGIVYLATAGFGILYGMAEDSDTARPTVTLPEGSITTVQNRYPLEVAIWDNSGEVAKICYVVNGKQNTMTGMENGDVTIPVLLSKGENQIQVWTEDSTGNCSETERITVVLTDDLLMNVGVEQTEIFQETAVIAGEVTEPELLAAIETSQVSRISLDNGRFRLKVYGLTVGENIITLAVDYQNGLKKQYQVTVYRK